MPILNLEAWGKQLNEQPCGKHQPAEKGQPSPTMQSISCRFEGRSARRLHAQQCFIRRRSLARAKSSSEVRQNRLSAVTAATTFALGMFLGAG